MKQKKKPFETVRTIIVIFMIMLVTILLIWKQTFYRADMFLSDFLCQRVSVASNKIFVIVIDDKILKEYGSIISWNRSLSADLVAKLNKYESARPAVIGLHI